MEKALAAVATVPRITGRWQALGVLPIPVIMTSHTLEGGRGPSVVEFGGASMFQRRHLIQYTQSYSITLHN